MGSTTFFTGYAELEATLDIRVVICIGRNFTTSSVLLQCWTRKESCLVMSYQVWVLKEITVLDTASWANL